MMRYYCCIKTIFKYNTCMHPVICPLLTAKVRPRLGYFIFMVRKHQIHTTSMKVKVCSKDRTLNIMKKTKKISHHLNFACLNIFTEITIKNFQKCSFFLVCIQASIHVHMNAHTHANIHKELDGKGLQNLGRVHTLGRRAFERFLSERKPE